MTCLGIHMHNIEINSIISAILEIARSLVTTAIDIHFLRGWQKECE
jgi:hypothetical protein